MSTLSPALHCLLGAGADAAQILAELATLSLPGTMVDGYARRQAGLQALEALPA